MSTPARTRPPRLLAATVVDELKRLIESGEVKPGERINEATLALRMGTSRGPIREAIRVLTGMGLVTPVANRGVFVRQVSVAEMLELYEMRALIFGFAVERATEFLTDARLATLRELLSGMEAATEAGDGSAYYQLNLRFHAALTEFSNNRRAAQAYDECVKELHLFRRPMFDYAGKMHRSNADHRAIVEAMAERRGADARRIAEEHVLSGRLRLLQAMAEERG
ncbi:MAG TPA: FCD domain-containing protein [Usitatibacter sp.]|nr:FCD domain-containing protein [Usitatibacter sp.]